MGEPRDIIRSGLLGAAHGFFTGVDHEGPPDPALLVDGGQLVKARQVHSAIAVSVAAPFAPDAVPEADALVTATPGLVLAIVTADCAPVLLCDPAAQIIGAAHAGWRGAFGGVLEATVGAMEALGADRRRIRAAIGPTIAQSSYEVDAGFRDRLLSADSNNSCYFIAGRTGHFQFDLPAYVMQRLTAARIHSVDNLALDTYADPARFHSFRRATHLGQPTYGRQFSLIGLPLPPAK